MLRRSICVVSFLFLVSVGGSLPGAALAIDVDDVLDICAPDANPCQVTSEADIADGTVLDFGLRTLVVTAGGRLDFQQGSGRILVGELVGTPNGSFLNAKGSSGGISFGGAVDIVARRGCSEAPTTPCLVDADCEGTCSVGSGSISIDGKMAGNANFPATFAILGAGDVALEKAVNLKGSDNDSDGGHFTVGSTQGSVRIGDDVDVSGGGIATGGSIALSAALDVTVDGELIAGGGEGDGGSIDVDAGRDYIQSGSLIADATGGDGMGGPISVVAVRDVLLTEGTSSSRRRISSAGNTDRKLNGGDGGPIAIQAGRDIRLEDGSRVESDGAEPDATGGEVALVAARDASLGGELRSRARGIRGAGGFVVVTAAGRVDIPETGSLDASGGSRGGGTVQIVAGGNFSNFGPIDVSGGNDGTGGNVDIESGDLALLEGSLVVAGASGEGDEGLLQVKACFVEVRIGGLFDNRVDGGENRLIGRESVILRLNAELKATESGVNSLIYGDPDDRPIVLGIVSPKALESLDGTLEPCPRCGNDELEEGEICDDGNLENGDGCSVECIDEGCIADTPGFPETSLCDDEDACTLDACDAALNACVNPPACDDGIECTEDACEDGECVSVPMDSSCEDGDLCTDNRCTLGVGCEFPNNDAPCDDGLFCTVDDTCSDGVCVGTPRICDDAVACTLDSCNEESDACDVAADNSQCGNGLFCDGDETCDVFSGCVPGAAPDCSGLDDTCNLGACDEEGDVCAATPANEAGLCDDGDLCTENDACSSGVCAGTAIPGCGICGNGDVDSEDEECDDGDTDFAFGDACNASCKIVPCGQPTDSGGDAPTTSDALYVLRASVSQVACSLAVCDASGDGFLRASDALVVLGAAVGRDNALLCLDNL